MAVKYVDWDGKLSDVAQPNSVANQTGDTYYIKWSRFYKGPFDPNNHKNCQFPLGITHQGEEVWAYRKVPEAAYKLYVRFLETRNSLYLTNLLKEVMS